MLKFWLKSSLQSLQAISLFYRGFALITISCSFGNAILVSNEGFAKSTLVILLTKTVVNALVWYFYHLFWTKEFFFYHHLYLSKTQLWFGSFSIDFLLMVLLLLII